MFRIWYKGGFEPEYPKWNGKENDKIVWCFRCGGVDYFKVRNDPETFIQRALEAQEIYHELGRGLDRETHISTLTVAIEAFNKVAEKWNKRDFKTGEELTKLGDLLKLMQDALTAPPPTEIIYKLASVMYFDNTEDPTRYDATYAAEKIARWKEFDVDPDVNGNFGGGFFFELSYRRFNLLFAELQRRYSDIYTPIKSGKPKPLANFRRILKQQSTERIVARDFAFADGDPVKLAEIKIMGFFEYHDFWRAYNKKVAALEKIYNKK